MIIDINAFIGNWPYWPVRATTAQDLVAELSGWHIDRAAICSTRSLFVNWEDGNRETEAAVRKYPQTLIPFACLGTQDLTPDREVHDYDFDGYQRRGFRGIRLYPQHHSYHPLFEAFVDRICEEAQARRWPILLPLRTIMNWAMPSLDPAVIGAVVERHPKNTWILAGINYLHELQLAVSLMRRFETVHLETSCVMGFEAIPKLVRKCGAEHILFGSGAPIQHGGANLVKIASARISDSAREAILFRNALRLISSDTEPTCN
jgi:predicted TIM-barrel fold metal-dependent hydrolase